MDQVAQLVSSLGFPVVVAGVLAWYINKLGDQHREEMNAVIKSLDANTAALIKLDTMVNVIWDKVTGEGAEEAPEEDNEICSQD